MFITKDKLLFKTGGKCAHCGRTLTEDEATVEHIFPKSKGGKNDEWNLTVLCKDCNFNKSNFVYDIYYYQYIQKEFRPQYREYHNTFTEKQRQGKLLLHEPQRICFFTEAAKYMLTKCSKRKPITQDMARRMSTWVDVYMAYPGDTEDVFALVDRCIKNKDFRCSSTYYDNEMVVLDEIKRGKVFAMRTKNNELCGAIFLKRYSDFGIEYPQITNTAESMNLIPMYVTTGFYCDRTYDEALIGFMEYLETRLLVLGIMPLFFEGDVNLRRHKGEMEFPVTLNGYSGTLYAPTPKSVRNNLAEEMKRTIFADEDYSTEDIRRFAEIWLKDRDSLPVDDKVFVKAFPKMEEELMMAKHDFREEHGLAFALNS